MPIQSTPLYAKYSHSYTLNFSLEKMSKFSTFLLCISLTKFRFWILTSSVFVLQLRLLIDAGELYTNFGNPTFRGIGKNNDCKMIAFLLKNLSQPVNRVAINYSGHFNMRKNWNQEWYLAVIIVCMKTFQASGFPGHHFGGHVLCCHIWYWDIGSQKKKCH